MALVEDYLQFGNVISFEVYPAAIIGTAFTDVKVLALLDKDTANLWIDADAWHANIYPTLPAGVPDDPNQYQYVKLKHLNGTVAVIGIPWIKPESMTISEKGVLTITVNDVGSIDKDRIIRALAANGYRIAKLTLK
jgi:hypothetical protein